ncbi:MAG: hypothetical protein HY654_11365, partial [Acidobacteria bacterium]|nr:hypothetical protein [Acidobacteriota bacterium]
MIRSAGLKPFEATGLKFVRLRGCAACARSASALPAENSSGSRGRWRDFAARVGTCGLFAALTWRIAADVVATGRLTGLLLLASEFLVVVLTLVRRP